MTQQHKHCCTEKTSHILTGSAQHWGYSPLWKGLPLPCLKRVGAKEPRYGFLSCNFGFISFSFGPCWWGRIPISFRFSLSMILKKKSKQKTKTNSARHKCHLLVFMWFALANRPFCPGLMMPLKKPFTRPLSFLSSQAEIDFLTQPPSPSSTTLSLDSFPTPRRRKCYPWAVDFFFNCHVH